MMKNCRNIEPELSALIDGELTADQRAVVRAHVDQCPACAQRLTELQQLAAGIGALPKLAPPPQFLAGIQRQLLPAKPLARWQEVWMNPVWPKISVAAVAAVTVITLIAGIFWLARPARSGPVLAKAEKSVAVPNRAITARILPVEIVPPPAKSTDEVKLTDTDRLTKSFAATGAIVDTSGGNAATRKLVDEVRVAPQAPVIIRGESLLAVRMCVTDLAKKLEGELTEVTASNTFIVHLPPKNVGTFRNAMTHLRKSESMYALSAAPVGPAAAIASSNQLAAAPVPSAPDIELEVIVESVDQE